VGFRVVLDAVVKRKIPSPRPGIEPYNPDRPAHAEYVYVVCKSDVRNRFHILMPVQNKT